MNSLYQEYDIHYALDASYYDALFYRSEKSTRDGCAMQHGCPSASESILEERRLTLPVLHRQAALEEM